MTRAPVGPDRRRVLLAGGALAVLAATPALADAGAEGYVRAFLEEANDLVVNAPDEAARFAGIDALVDRHVDMERVARFVLGQYARTMSDSQWADYLPLFRAYAKRVYRETLSEYAGERLEVVDSVDRSERDVVVNTRVVATRPGDRFANVVVHWRIYRDKSGAMSVFDAGAEGVWLAIEQQSQFKSVIANNGGGAAGVDALIADLRARTAG